MEKIGQHPNTSSVSDSEIQLDAGSTNTGVSQQATGKQLTAIIFILALATKMFLLPIFLIQATGRDGYIILAIYCVVDLISLVPMLIALRLCNLDFFELMNSVLGKVGAKISVGLIGLFLFFKLNTAVAEILAFYGSNVFTDFDTTLMIVVLLVFMVAVGTHTLRAICRLNELIVPAIVLCLTVLVAIVVMTSFDLANILPAVHEPKTFTYGLLKHASWLGDFTPLVLFVGRTKTKKLTPLFAAGAGVIGTGLAVFFALVLCAAFGNVPSLVDRTTNLSTILQYSVGNVYGRLDMFSSIVWSVATFIESALFFYCVCRCTAFVIGKNAHTVISICVCVAVYVVQVFALTDPMIFSVTVTSTVCSIAVPVFTLAIPLLTFICALIYKRKSKTGGTK